MSLALGLPGLVIASNTHDVHMILQELPGVEVFIEDMAPSLAAVGLSKEQLQTEIMQRLHNAGIRILTTAEVSGIPGLPVLYIQVKTAKYAKNIYAYHIDVSLREIVRLERNDLLYLDASSWSENELGAMHIKELKNLRNRIYYFVNKFIVSYQLANPHLLVAPTHAFPAHFSFEDRMREIQHRLKEAGFAPGPIDGQFGPMTKRALRQFQMANNLPITGNLDEVTQKALGISMVTSSSSDK